MLQRFHCEHVLQELGDFGYYQKKLIIVLIIPFAMLAAFQTNIIHNELVPDHWCRVEILSNFSNGEQHRLIRPLTRSSTGHLLQSTCEMYDIDYEQVIVGLEIVTSRNESSTLALIPTKKCNNGWIYNRNQYSDSAAMHYNWVCERREEILIVHLVRKLSSVFFSPIYAITADKFGRRLALMLILAAYVLSAASPLLSTNYYVFLACQAINGSTYPIAFLILLIYGIEFVSPPYRSYILAYLGLAFHFGEWISYLMTQLLSHWFWITAFNAACVLPYFFLLISYSNESPQWLLATSQPSKLKAVLERIKHDNSCQMDQDSLNSIISKFTHFSNFKKQEENRIMRQSVHNVGNSNGSQRRVKSAMEQFQIKKCRTEEAKNDTDKISFWTKIKLFTKRSTLFQMLFLFAFILITNQMITDFLTKQSNHFNDNVLIDQFLSSLIKMPVLVFTWYLVGQRTGRRWANCVILAFNFLVLLTLMLGQWVVRRVVWLNVTLSVFGIMLAECSTLITVLQTVELSSTRYRTLITSVVYSISQLITILVIHALYNHNMRLIFTFYTKIIFICCLTLTSILIASFVAESRNEFLPLGMLEAEQLITNVTYWSLSKKKSEIAPSNLFLSLSKWDINSNHQIVGSIKHMEKFTDS